MDDQAAHVVNESEEVGLAPFVAHQEHRTMHGVTLPNIVGQLGLEAPAVDRWGDLFALQPLLVQEAVDGGRLEDHVEQG